MLSLHQQQPQPQPQREMTTTTTKATAGGSRQRNSDNKSRTVLDPILALNVSVASSNHQHSDDDGDTRSHENAGDCDDDSSSSSLPARLSTLTSLCFLAGTSARLWEREQQQEEEEEEGSDGEADSDACSSSSDDDDDDELQFRCQKLAVRGSSGSNRYIDDDDDDAIIAAASPSTGHDGAAASLLARAQPQPRPLLTGRLLGTCHSGGECHVWDLGQRRVVADISSATTSTKRRRGPGLALRRVSDDDDHNSSSHFFYQTRDPEGTVTLHDGNRLGGGGPGAEFWTHSRTFCAAAPCGGNPHLAVAPAADPAGAGVRDWRAPRVPVALLHGAGSGGQGGGAWDGASGGRRHGMLMSLAMAETAAGNNSAVIACGMESGVVAFHDLAMLRGPIAVQQQQQQQQQAIEPGNIVLDRQAPVLSVDISLSKGTKTADESLVAIAGLANNGGDDEAASLESDPGRVAVIKARQRRQRQHDNETVAVWEPRLRARLSTTATTTTGTNSNVAGAIATNKLGAAACRFRPGDGRLFAVGGWDHRVRIYDRAAANSNSQNNRNHNSPPPLLALLRGHAESIRSLDWAPDARNSGLLATGSGDGWVHVWRCFASER